MEYILIFFALLLPLIGIYYTITKGGLDRQNAAKALALPPDSMRREVLPSMTRWYKFYQAGDNTATLKFLIEDDRRTPIITGRRGVLGQGVEIGSMILTIRKYVPGMRVRSTGKTAKGYETEFVLPSGEIWVHLLAASKGGQKTHRFDLDGHGYSLEWTAERGLWGMFGLPAWPGTLYQGKEPIAQIIRKDNKSWVGDFSNLTFIGCREQLSPEILALIGLISCFDFVDFRCWRST